MNLIKIYTKFKKHIDSGGLFYAFYRGIKYLIFLVSNRKVVSINKNNKHVIVKGRMKIACSNCGINIYWNENEITQGVGLNIAVNTLGLWTNSTKARWEVLGKDKDSFIIKITFKDIPLSQKWRMKVNSEYEIDWNVGMQIEVPLRIDEFRIVCLINSNYKMWICDYIDGVFPRLGDGFQDIYVDKRFVSVSGARSHITEVFPSFVLESYDNNLSPLIQNAPRDQNAHIIGLKILVNREEKCYLEGLYPLFNGKISLFEIEDKLDSKIESLRQKSFKMIFKEKVDNKLTRRKLKALLVNLPWQRNGKWGVRAGSRWPHIKNENEGNYLPFPFFLAYATALLQRHNIDVRMIDAIAGEITEDEFLNLISKENINYLVVETSIPSFYDDLAILKKIYSPGFSIILCGPNFEIYNPQFLKEYSFIEFVLYGEYEYTLLELFQVLAVEGDLSKIRGLIYRCGKEVVKNPKREVFDINFLPWPHRDSLPIYKYMDAPGGMRIPSVQMMASRGCPFKCQFCLWPQTIYQGNHYRPRNIDDVITEMEYLVKEKGFKSVYFDDDTFNIGRERMFQFCDRIRKRGLQKIQWAMMARPDLMDENMLVQMKKAGLWSVKYGVESAVQTLVDGIEKNMDLKKTEEMIKFTKELGIKVHLTFTFGLHGETKDTIKETINFVLKLNPFSVQFSLLTPFAGTKCFEILDKNGLIVSKNFSYYDGQYKSVIRSDNLTPNDLETAKEQADNIWLDNLRRRRSIFTNMSRFYFYTKNYGLGHSLSMTKKHLQYLHLVEKKQAVLNFNNTSKCPDIMLIQCPPWSVIMPPLGIAYLAAYLKKYGYQPEVFDLNIILNDISDKSLEYLWEQSSYDYWVNDRLFQETWSKLKDSTVSILEEYIKNRRIKYIGLSVNFAGINFAIEVLKIIKLFKSEIKIILGGWGCVNSHMRSLFPKGLVNVFVVGEGEKTLKEIIEVFNGEKKDSIVEGAVFTAFETEYKPVSKIMDLDSIPWPTFSEFDLSKYKSRSLPLFTSRGCIGCCSFCNDWAISKPYRFRKAVNIFEEIKYHVDRYKIENFSFKDLLCNGNIKELDLLADLLIDSGLSICWDSQAIALKTMTRRFFSKLRKAGCQTLIYGIESFSDNVLKRMRKKFSAKTAQRVVIDTYRAGIKTIVNIIVGFPGESEDDFQQTCLAIKNNREYISQIGAVSICMVNNDSDLELNPEKYGLVLPDDPKIRSKEWCSVDGKNNYNIRRERAERLFDLIHQIDLVYETKSI